MTHKYLLCSDMDRTLLPNGIQREEEGARQRFKRLAEHQDIVIAYVTGRDLDLVKAAIEEWDLPLPDFIIADVGANIYQNVGGEFHNVDIWQQHLNKDWRGMSAQDVKEAIGPLQYLALQGENAQKRFKLSYCISPSELMHHDLVKINSVLNDLDIQHQVVTSVDETQDEGLVDILPHLACKKNAIEFIVSTQQISEKKVFFAGDSGNDIDALISRFNTAVVANATPEVIEKVKYLAQNNHTAHSTYFAGKTASNGNYSAGVVEGFMHFFPEFKTYCVRQHYTSADEPRKLDRRM